MHSRIILAILTIWVVVVLVIENFNNRLFDTGNIYTNNYFNLNKSKRKEDVILNNNFIPNINSRKETEKNDKIEQIFQEIFLLSTTPETLLMMKGI